MLKRLAAFCLFCGSVAFAQTIAFRTHVIATDLKGGYQVVPADLNRDGRLDLIALASGMTELVWFENPTWQRHVIADGLNRMINVAPLDTDGDGIPELLLAHEFSNEAQKSLGTVSLLQHQGDPRGRWTVKEIDRLPTSHRIRIINGAFVNAPLTNETAKAPDYHGRIPVVLYRPGVWKREMLNDEDEGVMHGIFVTDWDGDGRQDLLTASFRGIHLLRSKQDGAWVRTRISPGSEAPWPKSGSSDVTVGRLGRKRFLASIEPWHGSDVVVYTEERRQWRRQVIDDTLVDGHTILTADFDRDGRDEIVAGYRGKGRSVYLYRYDGTKWAKSVVDDGGISAAACAAADLNSDGRPDLACIGSATANLKWYENVSPKK
jgi:FG-GAP repeat.